MSLLQSHIALGSPEFQANESEHRRLVADLRDRMQRVALGGGDRARERHLARGKLLPRERVEPPLRPGRAVPRALCRWPRRASTTEMPPAPGSITGIGRDRRPRCADRRQRRHGQGRHLLPDDGQEAPARPGDRAARTACPASTWSTPAAPSCRTRTMSSPTATTSAASSSTRRNMSAPGIAQIAAVMGSCTAGGAYVPAMSDETVIVRGQGTIFLGGPPLVKAATGEVVSAEELGGGDAARAALRRRRPPRRDDEHALEIVRSIVGHARRRARAGRGRDRRARAAGGRPGRALRRRSRRTCATPYDVREVIARIVDGSRASTSSRPPTAPTAGLRLRAHPGPSGRRSSPTTASSSPRAR